VDGKAKQEAMAEKAVAVAAKRAAKPRPGIMNLPLRTSSSAIVYGFSVARASGRTAGNHDIHADAPIGRETRR
jgi:hypothetical protein